MDRRLHTVSMPFEAQTGLSREIVVFSTDAERYSAARRLVPLPLPFRQCPRSPCIDFEPVKHRWSTVCLTNPTEAHQSTRFNLLIVAASASLHAGTVYRGNYHPANMSGHDLMRTASQLYSSRHFHFLVTTCLSSTSRPLATYCYALLCFFRLSLGWIQMGC